MIFYLTKLVYIKLNDSINLSIDENWLAMHFKGLAWLNLAKNENAKIAKLSVSLNLVTLR